ncbi:hypothetical protein BGZ61DRAFT_446008 [Ilyonectria robusta]|uniref:uncharacterized protein n=1 Tax=Ilyonectria robusta TaxID=1079257 RepID=UPI001E8E4902|nr:uncharacterized protein BGZ61DRAFT_446008 [Ilyonectria robusta]KAH8729229.1 hypothetical protein BGZ61DRAFT_446008 [Ilyonectria robusta]
MPSASHRRPLTPTHHEQQHAREQPASNTPRPAHLPLPTYPPSRDAGTNHLARRLRQSLSPWAEHGG